MSIVTQGRYAYVCDGKPIPVEEPFRIERQERGLVVSSQRVAPGTRMSIETVYGIGGAVHATIDWSSELEGTSPVTNVEYNVAHDGSVMFTGTDGQTRLIEVPEGTSFFPLMRVFSGRSLSKVVGGGADGADVLTPDIRNPKELERWLHPLVDRRHAASVVEGTLAVDGVERECRIVEYLGGSYDQPATVWLDGGGLLLRYTWAQPGVGDWDVRVADVEGEWPTPEAW
jgi:hypothetical protein